MSGLAEAARPREANPWMAWVVAHRPSRLDAGRDPWPTDAPTRLASVGSSAGDPVITTGAVDRNERANPIAIAARGCAAVSRHSTGNACLEMVGQAVARVVTGVCGRAGRRRGAAAGVGVGAEADAAARWVANQAPIVVRRAARYAAPVGEAAAVGALALIRRLVAELRRRTGSLRCREAAPALTVVARGAEEAVLARRAIVGEAR